MAASSNSSDGNKKSSKEGSIWKAAIELITSLSVVAGLVLYGVLTVAYEEFYRSIGLEPSDVGLTYGTTLARSSGLAVWFSLYLAFFTFVAIFWRWWANFYRESSGRLAAAWSKIPVILISSCLGIVLLATAVLLPVEAAMQARQVEHGKPVSAISLGPIVLLDIDVKRAQVQAVAAEGGSDSSTNSGISAPGSPVSNLKGKMLLYLGGTDSTIVMFDPNSGVVIYIPASSVVLRVGTRSP